MKLRKILKTILRPLAGVLACALLAAPMTAHAAKGDKIDASKSCAVSLVYKDRNGTGISGMRVRMYQIATVTGEVLADDSYTVKYALTPEFAKYAPDGTYPVTGFSEEALNDALKVIYSKEDRTARWQKFATTLAPYARADISPKASKATSSDGTISFIGLKPGLYLLLADGATIREADAEYRYTYHPTVMALPQFANGEWVYGSDAEFDQSGAVHPKCSYERIPIEYNYSIYKRWVNDGGISRPTSITVDLYRDGTRYTTITLSEENNWRYDWKSLGAYNWYAVERTTLTGYTVSMDVTGREITFTNTYNPPPPPPGNPPPPDNPPPGNPPPDNPPEEVLGARRLRGQEGEVLGVRRRGEAVLGARRLPQSGQLWWPVPVLMCAGVALILAGMVRRRQED